MRSLFESVQSGFQLWLNFQAGRRDMPLKELGFPIVLLHLKFQIQIWPPEPWCPFPNPLSITTVTGH